MIIDWSRTPKDALRALEKYRTGSDSVMNRALMGDDVDPEALANEVRLVAARLHIDGLGWLLQTASEQVWKEQAQLGGIPVVLDAAMPDGVVAVESPPQGRSK